MIQVILLILKITGIALLVLLGLLLLLITLVLFVPIRYRARIIYKPEHKEVTGRVSFLFPMLYVKFHYFEKFTYEGRLFGYRFLNSEKKKEEQERKPETSKEKKRKKQRKGQEEAEVRNTPAEQELPQEEKPEKPEQKPEQKSEEKKKSEEKEENTSRQEETKKAEQEQGFFEKWRLKSEKIRNTINKLKRLLHQKEALQRILNKPESRQAISFVWGKIKGLVRHMLPRKIEGYVAYGSSDPATTGQVLGVISVLYAKTGQVVRIIPNFEEEQLECDLDICGGIQVFTTLVIAVKVLMNEQLRKLIQEIKQIKEVE